MNRYLCFDVGNVLGRLDMKPFIDKLYSIAGCSETGAYEFLAHIQKVQDLGLYTIENELKYKFNIHGDALKMLLDSWNTILTPSENALNYYENIIKKYGLRVAIVSNVGIEHSKNFEVLFGKYEFFKNAIKHYSCDVGARKPTPIYYHMLTQMHPEFKKAVYVDDLLENLETGKKFGFKTHHLNLSELPEGSVALQEALTSLQNTIVNG